MVGGTGLEGQDGVELVVLLGDHDDRQPRGDGGDPAEDGESLGVADLGVQDHQGRGPGRQEGDALVAGRRGDDVESLDGEGGGQGVAGQVVVVDDQDDGRLLVGERPSLDFAERQGHGAP